jgi:hypothetical protein
VNGKLLQWFVRFDVSAALRPSGPMAPPGADYPRLSFFIRKAEPIERRNVVNPPGV